MRTIPARYVEPFLPSANRRHLMAGMEFPAFLFSLWAPVMIAFQFPNRYGVGIGVSLFSILSWIFRQMARRDPFMTEIYLEALRYRQVGGGLEFPAVAELPILIKVRKKAKDNKKYALAA